MNDGPAEISMSQQERFQGEFYGNIKLWFYCLVVESILTKPILFSFYVEVFENEKQIDL